MSQRPAAAVAGGLAFLPRVEALNEDTLRGGLHGETGPGESASCTPPRIPGEHGMRSSEKAGVIRHRQGRGMRAAALTSGKNSSRGSAHRPSRREKAEGTRTRDGGVRKAAKDGAQIRRACLFTRSCPTLCDPKDYYSPWNSPGQNTGVGSLSLLQGIFPTQG